MNRALECVTRFGLATFCLASRHSTTELHTHTRLAEFYWTENLYVSPQVDTDSTYTPWTSPLAKGCPMSCKGVQEISRFTPITKLRHLVLPYKRLGFVGAPSRIWTDDLVITNHLLYRWAIEAGEREFFRLFLAATKWLVKMLDYFEWASEPTTYPLRVVLCWNRSF